ncbi:MAG: DinB family protein [Bryobacteraceae bacterium]
MTAAEIRHHIFYSSWASRKLLNAARALSEEEQNREFGVSHKSLKGTLDHIFLADRVWFARAVDPGVLERDAQWPEIQKEWEDWATALSDDEILRVVDYKDLKGNVHQTPVWQIVLHVVNHATLHRGQAMSLLRQLGVAAPSTDLIFYYREIMVK